MTQRDVTIIGAGLTGLTLAYLLNREGITFRLLEKETRTGGVIRTESEDGFVYECGPNTGTVSTAELVELTDMLGASCKPVTARNEAERRLILKKGEWHALPSGLFSAISTPLFSLKDKFRILGEPFRAPGSNPDESVAELVKRRLGNSFLDYAVDPFVSGIYAGDPERLVTRHALPKLWNLEQQYGSFIKGSLAKARQKKTELERRVTREVFSFTGGLQTLTDTLTNALPADEVITGSAATVTFSGRNSFLISYKDHDGTLQEVSSRYVVSTTGSYTLPGLLPFIPAGKLNPVTELVYAGVVQIAMGYNSWNGSDIRAFGGLVPSIEKIPVLGILFPSSIFDGRAPEGGVLMSVFAGGMRAPDLISRSDEELKEIALSLVKRSLNAPRQEPDLIRIFRYRHAIPQYEASTEERLKCINEIESTYQGLILAGNIRNGIGMADRIKQASILARQIHESLWHI